MYKAERNRIYMRWFYLFVGSFLLGIIIMNVASRQILTEEGLFGLSMMNRLKYIEIDDGHFFPFVLKHRLLEGTLILLLSTTGIGVLVIYADIFWKGFLLGMFFTAAAVRFGMKGFLLIMAGILPHQLLLIPASVMLLGWCYENCCHAHFAGKNRKFLQGNKRQYYVHQGIVLVWILAVFVIGCILESYVNPILVSEVVKIF